MVSRYLLRDILRRREFCGIGNKCLLSSGNPVWNSCQAVNSNFVVEVDNLRSVFGITKTKAKQMLKRHPSLKSANIHDITASFNYLTSNKGVPLSRLIETPLLLLTPAENVEERLKVVMKILPSITSEIVALSFMDLHWNKLVAIRAVWASERAMLKNFGNRVQYLAHHLKCSEWEISDIFCLIKQLATFDLVKIDTVLKLLLDGGIKPADIKVDTWIFLHNLEFMTQRLKDCKARSLAEIKPWMLRSSDFRYELYVKRAIEEQKLLGNDDISGFLARRLNLSPMQVNDITTRLPLLKQYSAIKLERMISFLISKGFNEKDISKCPKILQNSVATVACKLQELYEIAEGRGYPISSLNILTQNSKVYSKFVESLRFRRYPIKVMMGINKEKTEQAQNGIQVQ